MYKPRHKGHRDEDVEKILERGTNRGGDSTVNTAGAGLARGESVRLPGVKWAWAGRCRGTGMCPPNRLLGVLCTSLVAARNRGAGDGGASGTETERCIL